MTDAPRYIRLTDPDITVEVLPEPESDYAGDPVFLTAPESDSAGDPVLWMPMAGLERGRVEMPDIQMLTKQKFAAMGISEEFLNGSKDYGTSFSETAINNRIEISAAGREALNATFKRVLRKTMAPNVFCKAVPGGASVLGKRFRSLRLARVFYKTIFKNAQFKNIQAPIDPGWKKLAD